MIPMLKPLRETVAREIGSAQCARKNADCSGRITVEHPFGRKVQKRWMFCYLCEAHHLGKFLNKEINKHICYQQATDKEIQNTFPKTFTQHLQAKSYLVQKYGC